MADRYSERGAQRWEDERPQWDERGFFDRLRDELRSWFGDEEAQRRRIRDEREDYRGERRDWGARDWGARDWSGRSPSEWSREPDPREWSRQWGYTQGRDYGVYRGTVSEQRESGGAWRPDQDWGRYSEVLVGGSTCSG